MYTEPLRNQQDGNPPRRIRDDVYTIPELLSAAGHHTYFSTAVVTAEFPIRGRFPTESLAPDATATTLVDDALSWWDAHDDAARFAYLHLGDLHEPLPRPASQPFGDVPDIEGLSRWRFTRSTEPRDQFETYRRERIRLYDTVLRTVDRALERLFAELERRGDREDTLVVVTGDHGEEFWERESLERDHFHDPRGVYGTGHGHALVPEVLEVPLWIPGVDLDPPGLVSTTDLVPTVLSHLGYPAEELARFDGVPLQEVGPDRTLFAEEIAYGYDQRAVIDRDYHLIHSPYENETVVLDRDSDAIVHDTALAESLIEEIPSRLAVGETLELDELARRRLTDLGYGE